MTGDESGRTRESYVPIIEHVVDRFGFVWRVVRGGGMLTRADYGGIKSIGIAVAERDYGPLAGVYARVETPHQSADVSLSLTSGHREKAECGTCGGTGLVRVISQDPPDDDERICRDCTPEKADADD